jgi:ribA/ribD-fused uncharacterized protein
MLRTRELTVKKMKPEDTRNIKELIKVCNSGANPKFIFFWGHTPPKSGEVNKSCFSQWFSSSFKVDKITYPTAEHYMMAEKARLFNDYESLNKILSAPNPGTAKVFGREVKGFNENKWVENRFNIVANASYHKFNQNSKLKDFLINTKKRVLVEASPKDTIWGIGLAETDEGINQPVRWRGLNILGFALMEARAKLINEHI